MRSPSGSVGRRLATWFAASAGLALVCVTLGLVLLGAPEGSTSGPTGLYFRGNAWAGPAVHIEPRSAVTTTALKARAEALGPGELSVIWVGFLYAERAGDYTFTVTSDDGSWLYVDDVLVVDNAGTHAMLTVSGRVTLAAGAHRVTLRYVQNSGDLGIDGSLISPDGTNRSLGSALFASSGEAVRAQFITRAARLVALTWTIAVLTTLLWWPTKRFIGRMRHDGPPRLTLVVCVCVAAVAVVAVFGITWGLPSSRAWAPDEVVPRDVLYGVDRRFSGGWHHLYPPAQFYLLTLLYAPFFAASHLGFLQVRDPAAYALLFLVSRGASAVMASIAAATVYLTSRELGASARAGLYALIVAASTPVFVYYGRVANVDVPYVMWYALALWAYAIILRRGPTRLRLGGLGVAAALSVTTKDQAYAFFVLIAAHLAGRSWSSATFDSRWARARHVATDRLLWTGLLAFCATFLAVHNVALNFEGFMAHVQVITGPASSAFRMYGPSLRDQGALVATAAQQLPWCLGWPSFLASLGGLVLAWRRRSSATLAVVLVPAVSFYAFLLTIVGYHYDRFFLGLCLGLAIPAGLLLDWIQEQARLGIARHAVVGATFAFSIAYGASVPLLMRNDSRYDVEVWLRDRLPRGATVAFVGPRQYLPRLGGFDAQELEPSAEGLRELNPVLCVTSWGHSLRSRSDPERWRFYEALEAATIGYRKVLAYRNPVPTLLGLSPRLSAEDSPFTNLNKINPEIRIYERIDGAAASP